MSIFPKLKHDYKVALQILCDGALRNFDKYSSEEDNILSGMYFLNIVRMLRWMEVGGYRVHHDDNGINIEETNLICLSLLKDMELDPKLLSDQMLLLTEPSPFTVDDDVLEIIKEFLIRLRDDLKSK